MTAREFHPVADIFPLMEGEAFETLVADIRAHGLREPIWLHQDGRIIDGRNRHRACQRAGQETRFQNYIGPDEGLVGFLVSMNLHRRHLNESQRAMAAARMANMRQGERTDLSPIGEKFSQARAASMFSVGKRSVERAKAVFESGTDELVQAVDRGAVKVSDAAAVAHESHAMQHRLLSMLSDGSVDTLKTAHVRLDIERQRLEISEGHAVLPEGVFEVIAVDPPWPYDTNYSSAHFHGRVSIPYPEIPIAELRAIELPAAKNCVLWLWTTNAFMGEACDLIDAWEFRLKTILTWVKPRLGVGRWLRNRTEHCLLAVKGSPRVDLTNQSTVLEAPGREHSRKPDEFYEMIESLCVGRRLDYFSREPRTGWAQFGSEPTKFAS